MQCRSETYAIAKFSIDRGAINTAPDYQRAAGVWGRKKQQLFLDTLFNHYDVPKIYMHALEKSDELYAYALVDGKQRLHCIWDFLDSKIPLGKDFEHRPANPAARGREPYPKAGDTFGDLSEFWQEQFKGILLNVVLIHDAETADLEELFSRLNSGEPFIRRKAG